jgi:hypothetical protein
MREYDVVSSSDGLVPKSDYSKLQNRPPIREGSSLLIIGKTTQMSKYKFRERERNIGYGSQMVA